MNTFIISMLAASLAGGIAPSVRLFQADGMLQSKGQIIRQLPTLKAGKGVIIFTEATGKGGELACYLLAKSQDGYRVVASDEKDGSTACYLTYTPTDNEPARLWLRNNGTNTVHFDTTVDQ